MLAHHLVPGSLIVLRNATPGTLATTNQRPYDQSKLSAVTPYLNKPVCAVVLQLAPSMAVPPIPCSPGLLPAYHLAHHLHILGFRLKGLGSRV
jgi:hypothetical protein